MVGSHDLFVNHDMVLMTSTLTKNEPKQILTNIFPLESKLKPILLCRNRHKTNIDIQQYCLYIIILLLKKTRESSIYILVEKIDNI